MLPERPIVTKNVIIIDVLGMYWGCFWDVFGICFLLLLAGFCYILIYVWDVFGMFLFFHMLGLFFGMRLCFPIFWGYVFLKETITLATFIGVILILFGVFLGQQPNVQNS